MPRGRVLIESPEFPRGLWVDLVDEAGRALAGIQVGYQGQPDSLVAIWSVDPSGHRQETLLWTRQRGPSLGLMLKSGESAELPAGLTSIDWRIDPSVQGLPAPDRLVGWEAVADFLRMKWRGQEGVAVVRIDDISMAVDLERSEATETLVRHLQETHQPVSESLSETPIFGAAAVTQSSNLLPSSAVILQTACFESENLEAAVREALDRRHGKITRQDVASLTLLDASQRYIQSLAGLERFTSLGTLNLRATLTFDVLPLAALTSLKSLELSVNRIVDVGPLASLTRLEELGLSGNRIVDVGPLASLTRLEELSLSANEIVDVGPLASLARLEELGLSGNRIVDVGPLASLTRLEELSLSANEIVDVGPLASLTRLEALGLSENRVVDVGPLASLTRLKWLWLNSTGIVDVGPLIALANLEGLYVMGNESVDVNTLAALTSLRALGLGTSQITDVRFLAALTKLEYLNLSSNEIVDVSSLAALTSLRILDLRSNQIKDISPLVANIDLGEGDHVYLEGNPLSDRAINEQIPALKARGVTVRH